MNKGVLYITTFLLLCACSTSKIALRKTEGNSTTVKTTETAQEIKQPVRQEQVTEAQTTYNIYESTLSKLNAMLSGEIPHSFKEAVYLTENAYYDGYLDHAKYLSSIDRLVALCGAWMENNRLNGYDYPDSIDIQKNGAIFRLMSDTIFLVESVPIHFPYRYNFNDFLAQKSWSNQFVTTLLDKGNGNCHSLPYLYKILADELKTDAYLSLAPNHIYIKQQAQKWGWYNTELTSNEFPTDAWVKASGYITLDAIRNGLYMDALTDKQSIALCVYDLAKGYLVQTGNYRDGFALKCCDLVLKHHPSNINAIILKAETLKRIYNDYIETDSANATQIYAEMQSLYIAGLKLGYREMPVEMYQSWLLSVKEQKDKYANTEITRTFNTHQNE